MGLPADALIMLYEAFVYRLSLRAVGSTLVRKNKVARLSSIFLLALALPDLMEVTCRYISSEEAPDFGAMIIVSVCALIDNFVCLYLLQKSKSKEAHIKATTIFTSNPIITNTGVIAAGVFVIAYQFNNIPI